MARTSTYLNFATSTEEAFNFYRSVFGGDFAGPMHRFSEIPATPGQPEMPAENKNLVMHVALPILGGHMLMGSDAPPSMGFTVTPGNNCRINLEPDTREEADRLFAALAENGKVESPLQDMFWGDYFGSLIDQYGVMWMVNYSTDR